MSIARSRGFPAASVIGSRSRARCSAARNCSCWTSRPSGLDPLLRRDLWALFERLRDEGATLLVSTHVLDEAGRCDDVLLLREGRLLAATTADGLRADTGTDDLDEAFVRLIERREATRERARHRRDRAAGCSPSCATTRARSR